jgi:hypothetical protein
MPPPPLPSLTKHVLAVCVHVTVHRFEPTPFSRFCVKHRKLDDATGFCEWWWWPSIDSLRRIVTVKDSVKHVYA